MDTKIQKWGNSYGVRLPMEIINENKILAGTPVKISEAKNKIIIEYFPNKTKKTLATLLVKIKPENIHNESSWGKSQGKEAW